MRPTFSIIFFTVMSGAGYGLWILTALASVLSASAHDPARSAASLLPGLAVGFLLVSSGLVSSVGHLGRPRRAWRAFSQWRSSWLSREGVAAVLTYVPVVAIGFAATPLAPTSLRLGETLLFAAVLLVVVGSLATVFCTANIYACIKPVRAWHNRHVVPGYLLLAIYSGGLWTWALASVPGGGESGPRLIVSGLIVAAVAGAVLKSFYWRFLDRDVPATTGEAIGLASLGSVRSFEHPHTEENYLTHEMGFRVARRHARKLRRITLIAAFLVPSAVVALALSTPSLERLCAWLALAFGMTGIFIERWLFFAEARHTVMLYYGSRSA